MEKCKIKQWAKANLKNWLAEEDIGSLFDNDDLISCINNCTSPRANKKNNPITEDDLKLIFKAFSLFKPSETRVLILGQDPYPEVKRAQGLAFSFKNNQKPADDSLLNIFKAIEAYKTNKNFYDISDTDIKGAKDNDGWNTNLETWATSKGILLLNTALTHENKDTIKNHREKWEFFIQQVIKNLISCKLNNNNSKLAVFLWGNDARNTFLRVLNEKKSEYDIIFGETQQENQNKFRYTNKNKLKIINRVIRAQINIKKDEKNIIEIYMTSHPSNNRRAVYKGFSEDVPNHFESCDEFLEDENGQKLNIWKNFPEK